MFDTRLELLRSRDPAGCTFAVACGVPELARTVIDLCQDRGFVLHPDAGNVVVLDLPFGFALRALQSLERTRRRIIVVTWNTSAEYLEDVWALQPAIMLAGQTMEVELPVALIRASQGDRYRCTAGFMTALAPPERAILQGVARGLCNQQIADHLGIQEKTVRNILTTVYAKLGVDNRTQAALRYWGRQDLLD
ncbi:MAG: LuxR C-terminal-related transcriptional regulator [Chloroflexota bacterium]|nr:LuxR C-terminal-related transcriptional regulator [Chloroflexota bacterium]